MSRKPPRAPIGVPDDIVQALADGMIELGIDSSRADLVIVGDGSGTTWKASCGWAAVMVDLRSNAHKVIGGAADVGTSYIAELLPYVYGLSWYLEGPGQQILAAKLRLTVHACVNVHIITDNQAVARQGRGEFRTKVAGYYWAMFDAIEDRGYKLHWHWAERQKLWLNRICDYLAGQYRTRIEAVSTVCLPEGVSTHAMDNLPRKAE